MPIIIHLCLLCGNAQAAGRAHRSWTAAFMFTSTRVPFLPKENAHGQNFRFAFSCLHLKKKSQCAEVRFSEVIVQLMCIVYQYKGWSYLEMMCRWVENRLFMLKIHYWCWWNISLTFQGSVVQLEGEVYQGKMLLLGTGLSHSIKVLFHSPLGVFFPLMQSLIPGVKTPGRCLCLQQKHWQLGHVGCLFYLTNQWEITWCHCNETTHQKHLCYVSVVV